MTKNTHGGKREGAGRPPRPDKKMRRHAPALRPQLWDALEQLATKRNQSLNSLIEEILMEYVDIK